MVGKKNKNRSKSAMTLLEMVIALAIIVIIIAVFAPQLKTINNSWASKQANAEVLQNARVLVDQVNRSLSSADKIIDVSDSTETNGYIEFEDNTGTAYRMDIAANNYIEYGPVGSLSDLAGPVSQLKITCYDDDDLDTPVNISVDGVDGIRFVKTEVIFPNPGSGQDRTFTTSTYLRTNTSAGTSGCLGWWKLDETSGLTANDSSGNDNHGTLNNMAGDEWTDGAIDGALEFDGSDDYIAGIGDCPTSSFTVIGWAKDTGPTGGSWSVLYSAEQEIWLGIDHTASPSLYVDVGGNGKGANTAAGTWTRNVWHHIAATWDESDIHLYIDGIDMPITVYGTPENPKAKAAAIGAYSKNPTSETWYGELDDVRIYDCALTVEEIAGLANTLRYCEFTEAKVGSDDTSITINTPSGTSQDDLLIAAVATDGNTSSSLAPPFGQGWTGINIDSYMSQVTLGAWWKLADASESPTHQFTWSGSEQAYGWMMLFNGHDAADPIDIYATGGDSSSTPTSPAVTTTVSDVLILRLGAFDENDITIDAPGLTGHTAITMDRSSASGSGQVSYEQFTEKKQSPNDNSVTINTPSGTSGGDLLITAVVTDGGTDSSLAPPGGEGWSQISIADQSNGLTLGVWWKNADASESSTHQFTWGGSSQEAYGWMMRFTGHDSGSPIHKSSVNGGSSSSPQCNSVSTTLDNCMILRIGGFDDDDVNVDNTGLSGHTDITMDESNSGNGTCSGGAGYIQQPSAGASGISNFSLTGSEQYRTVTIAIAPASGGGSNDSVSGGAGYVRQSSSGDSGTSSFALTASQDSQMITIGITPDPAAGGVGGGGLLP